MRSGKFEAMGLGHKPNRCRDASYLLLLPCSLFPIPCSLFPPPSCLLPLAYRTLDERPGKLYRNGCAPAVNPKQHPVIGSP